MTAAGRESVVTVASIQMAPRIGREAAQREAGTMAIARKEFPQLEPAVVDAAVKRMLTEGVYPKSVDITPQALTVAMQTPITLGNLKAQPVYDTFIDRDYIKKALATQ